MKLKKKTAALLFACAWAIFSLAASVAFRAVTANALSVNDPITVHATDLGEQQGLEEGTEFVWGTFYRGVELLTSANYKTQGGATGNVTVSQEGDDIVNIGELAKGHSLNTNGNCEHDFTQGGAEYIGEQSHYAKCAQCGLQFEVAHRPNAEGKCADCGEALGDAYTNQYEFTLPEFFSDSPIEWSGNTAEFDIGINTLNIFAGFVLELKLSCAGALKTENGAPIPYAVEVTGAGLTGEMTYTPTGGSSINEETIWEFKASEYLSGGADLRTYIGSGSITVTLTLNFSGSPPAGTFTDTLTFSVTMKEEEGI